MGGLKIDVRRFCGEGIVRHIPAIEWRHGCKTLRSPFALASCPVRVLLRYLSEERLSPYADAGAQAWDS